MEFKYKYYPNSIKFILGKLKKRFPRLKPSDKQENMPAYLFWMIKKMQKFNDPIKVGRWIGWIFSHAEMLGLLTNIQSRRLAKKDVKSGKDK